MYGRAQLAAARVSVVAALAGALLASGPGARASAYNPPAPKHPFAYDTSGEVNVGAAPASVSGPAVLQFQGVADASYDLKSGQAINLGQFVAVPSSLASGQATTYTGTPFEVEIQAPEFDKTSSVPVLDKVFPTLGKDLDLKTTVENSLLLKGHLDGTVGANGQVNVVATIDSIKLGSMDVQTQDHVTHYTFPIRYSQLKLPAGWVISGTSPVTIPSTTPASVASVPMIPAPTATTSAAAVTPAPVAEPQLIAPATAPAAILPTPAAEALITPPTPTPEPSTIAFFALTLGGLALGHRRIRNR